MRTDQCTSSGLYELVDKLCRIVQTVTSDANKASTEATAAVSVVCGVLGISTIGLSVMLYLKSKGTSLIKKPNLNKTKQIDNVDEIRE